MVGDEVFFSYILAQTSAVMTSIESVSSKSALEKYSTFEHVFYKNFIIFLFAIVLGMMNWHVSMYGLIYTIYAVVVVYFNENLRSKAMQSLELNAFSLLVSSSVFVIYGLEVLIGREELIFKNVIGISLFVGSFFLFLDVRLRDFLKINKVALLNIIGIVIIVSLDRPIAKTVFDNGWISPETAVLLKVFALVFVFYYFGRKKGMKLKGRAKEGMKVHSKIGFLKYTREMLYTYALVIGSVLTVTLALSTVLFLTFIISGFYFKESRWTARKGVSIVIAVFSLILISI